MSYKFQVVQSQPRLQPSFSALILLIGMFVMFASFASSASAGEVKVDVTRIGDATHIEFSGSSDWKYDLKRAADKSDQVVLRVPGVKTEALAKLRGISDKLIKKVQVNENGIDNTTEINFTVVNSSDFFDYITDQPSRLILDFFPKDDAAKPALAKSQAKAQLKVETLPPKISWKVQHRTPASKKDDADDSDDEDDTEDVADAGNDSRKPAGSDTLMVAKGVLPPPLSLAEQISSKKDFSHGIFDGGDPEFKRFSIKDYEIKEESIIGSRANYYLPFPMLELGVPQLRALISAPPSYEIVANDTRENKEARVLLMFYSKNQRALFLKTAAEFLESHPNSPYDEIVRYMMADSYFDIYRAANSVPDFETAMSQYLALSEKYPTSPMAPRTLLLMGYSYLDRGDSFGALKAFQRFTRLHPDSKQIDRVNISIAEAYLRLNRFDDAYALLDQVEKGAKSAKGREEAAFRKGDVFFRRKEFAEAINQYKGAIQRFPAAAPKYPNAYYNIAESQFVQQKYRDGLDSYRDFLVKFPDHDHGGYAMTRMGELLGILGADPQRGQGAFLESYFRYRATPGAGIARIRSLTARMPEMKEKEVASSIREIEEITKKYANRPKSKKELEAEKAQQEEELKTAAAEKKAEAGHGGGEHAAAAGAEHAEPQAEAAANGDETDSLARLVPKDGEYPTRKTPELPGIEEFSTLLIADGFNSRHEYDKATDNLISFYQKNPQSPNKDKLKARIVRNMSDAIKESVDKGDFIDALRRYSKNADGWLKNTERIDVRFNVGKAYEQAGVAKEAMSIYNDSLKRLMALKGTKNEKERGVFENLPKLEEVQLRLAAVNAREKEFATAQDWLKKIGAGAQLTEAQQIERAEVSSQVAEARGQGEIARKYMDELIGAWKGDPQLTSPLHLRIARLQIAAKNYKDADAHLAKLLEWKKEDGARVSDDIHAQALELRGDLQVSRGKRNEAAKSYRDLLEAYEASRPLASVRYRLGQLLYQDGDLKGAEAVWKELKPDKDNLWQRLAAEQMQGAKWQNEYKKYLNRIPAAVDLRDSASNE